MINSTEFVDNTANEGGAVHVRGDVDVIIDRCAFKRNRAVIEGGAVKVRNFASATDELVLFRITNSIATENRAGIELFEDIVLGKETQGGAILAEGNGIELELLNNMFSRNTAFGGGALSIFDVVSCNIEEDNR